MVAELKRKIDPADEINSLLSEAEQRKAAQAMELEDRKAMVYGIAEPLGYNPNELQTYFRLLATLKKAEYGGIPDIQSPFDTRLTPEIIKNTLEAYQADEAARKMADEQARQVFRDEARQAVAKKAKTLSLLQAIPSQVFSSPQP
jgi:hypothetical protein